MQQFNWSVLIWSLISESLRKTVFHKLISSRLNWTRQVSLSISVQSRRDNWCERSASRGSSACVIAERLVYDEVGQRNSSQWLHGTNNDRPATLMTKFMPLLIFFKQHKWCTLLRARCNCFSFTMDWFNGCSSLHVWIFDTALDVAYFEEQQPSPDEWPRPGLTWPT